MCHCASAGIGQRLWAVDDQMLKDAGINNSVHRRRICIASNLMMEPPDDDAAAISAPASDDGRILRSRSMPTELGAIAAPNSRFETIAAWTHARAPLSHTADYRSGFSA